MARAALVSAPMLLLALACTPSEPRDKPASAPEVGVPPAPPVGSDAPTPSVPPRPEAPDPAAGADGGRKTWQAGQVVVARGKLSRTPWQHLMTGVAGKKSEYFDLDEGGQTVIYVKDAPSCDGWLIVEGTVLSVRGPSKRPRRETKVDDSYEELQLDVSAARCQK